MVGWSRGVSQMTRNSYQNIKSKYGSWSNSNPRHIEDELKSRRLYNETRGTQFKSETVVVKNRERETASDYVHSQSTEPAKKPSSQCTMGLFSSSMSGSGGGKGGGSARMFERLMKDAESGANPYAHSNGNSSSASSWTKGISNNIPCDKKASIERHLKWMSKLESDKQQQHLAPAQQPQAVGELHPGVNAPEALSLPQPEEPSNFAVDNSMKELLSKPENMNLFNSIRNRIGNLLLYDLPVEVTAELRQLGKDLEQLNSYLC